jgi:hypothetical protein
MVLRNIRHVVRDQANLDSMVEHYLGKQRCAQHVDSVTLKGTVAGFGGVVLQQLPEVLLCNLKSLQLEDMSVQLQSGGAAGHQGLLGFSHTSLTKLLLLNVAVTDTEWALPAGSHLQHLAISGPYMPPLPVQLLSQHQQQLTCLWLNGVLLGQDTGAFLRFQGRYENMVCLTLGEYEIREGIIASMPALQRLSLKLCILPAGMLVELQQRQQLTHVDLVMCQWEENGPPPAGAFAALTASSRLQHLSVRFLKHGAGALDSMLDNRRQLPNLKQLTWGFNEGERTPSGSSIVRCCPGLEELHISMLHNPWGVCTQLLSPLCALVQLTSLSLKACRLQSIDVLHICSISGLREMFLSLKAPLPALWQLSNLRSLTDLRCGQGAQGQWWIFQVSFQAPPT